MSWRRVLFCMLCNSLVIQWAVGSGSLLGATHHRGSRSHRYVWFYPCKINITWIVLAYRTWSCSWLFLISEKNMHLNEKLFQLLPWADGNYYCPHGLLTVHATTVIVNIYISRFPVCINSYKCFKGLYKDRGFVFSKQFIFYHQHLKDFVFH